MSSLRHRLLVSGLLGASLSLLGFGCATGSGDVRHGVGAGYWEDGVVSLPSRQSPIQALAFGSGGSAEPASDLGVDAALAALDRTAVQPAAAPRAAKLVAAKTAEPAQLALAAAPQAEQTQEPVAASRAQVDEPVLLAANTQESRYASREAQSDEQQKFAGGDAVIITSGAIVLVLLIVLLVLLLR